MNVHTDVTYREIEGRSRQYFILLAAISVFIALGLGAAYYMEHHGHYITGMSNQIVWGIPHVFAVFLIIAASGALNIASIASVFERTLYKPLARMSGLVALASLAGGLMVLVLDLGRPDRLIIAMTTYNFKSIFAWNIFLYTGLFGIVGFYLWSMMDNRYGARFYKPAALATFLWRLALTTGTGSIFGFLVARDAYNSAIMAPLFIAMSFAFGKAVFLLILISTCHLAKRPLGRIVLLRLQRLTGIVLAATCYFVVVQHMTNLYMAERQMVEMFILFGGNVYSFFFWVIQIILGTIVPLVLLLYPRLGGNISAIVLASLLVIIGGIAQLYVIIIGGQSFPLSLFPGMDVMSTSFDGKIGSYLPTLPEFLLGLSGIAVMVGVVMVAMSALRFLPLSLADTVVDPDHVHDIIDQEDEAVETADAEMR
ncbi:Sulfite reduction-associated complex DsrMKJOP protein DsrP (= HmeB) [invertebrate metagenome]|uniref:Sulfite reduction-associated complex DsrMKJOP protein DsrP (= HmeB) n=1 Tax=invertebrate metagenome TaxID=1711999 RepID=A0A484HDC4_9ZZZZ